MISALPTAMLSGGLVICPLMVICVVETQRLLDRRYAVRAINGAPQA
jgi:hypothetical protein